MEAPYPDISAELLGIELERNQTEDQTDGPTDAIENEPELDFEERAVGALENADLCHADHRRDQPVAQPANDASPARPGEVIYNTKIDLPDSMEPMTINNDRLAANKGAVMAKDVDADAKFEDGEEVDVPHPSYSTSCSSRDQHTVPITIWQECDRQLNVRCLPQP